VVAIPADMAGYIEFEPDKATIPAKAVLKANPS